MKKIGLIVIITILVNFGSFAQCTNPYAGEDTVCCGNTILLNIENATTGYWAVINADTPDLMIDIAPAYTSAEIIIIVSDFTIIELVWYDDSGPCTDTILVEFLEIPIIWAGEDQDVCGPCAELNGITAGFAGTWLPNGCAFTDYSDPTTEVCVSSYGDFTFIWLESNQATTSTFACSAQDEVVITFWREPTANILTSPIDSLACGHIYDHLSAEYPGSAIFGYWYSPCADVGSGGEVTAYTYGSCDIYWVEETGPALQPGFCNDTAGPFTIHFYNNDIVYAGIDDSIYGLDFNLMGIAYNSTNPQYSIATTWQNASAIFEDIENDTCLVSVVDYGEYEFVLNTYYENYSSCTDTDTVNISFLDASTLSGNSLIMNISSEDPFVYFSPEDVVVNLYMQDIDDSDIVELYSQQYLGTNNQVVFDNLPDGVYYVCSQLVSPDDFPQLFPNICFFQTLDMTSASSINIEGESVFTANIQYLIASLVEGSNSASGIVGIETLKSISGIEGLTVVLYNSDIDEIINTSITNSDGEYFFANIPDYTNIDIFVSNLELPNITEYSIQTETEINYTVNFIIDGNSVFPEEEAGIVDFATINNIVIYPNPARSFINIISQETIMHVIISDIRGSIVSQKITEEKHLQLDISDVPAGMYFVQIETKSGISVKKFIKD